MSPRQALLRTLRKGGSSGVLRGANGDTEEGRWGEDSPLTSCADPLAVNQLRSSVAGKSSDFALTYDATVSTKFPTQGIHRKGGGHYSF